MANTLLGDSEVVQWCGWLKQRLSTKQRYVAQVIDLSENSFGAMGARELCALLEQSSITCMQLMLNRNSLDDEALTYVTRYLTAFKSAPVRELNLSHNQISARGIKWLLAGLAVHPAYPAWIEETQVFAPLWIQLDHNSISDDDGEAVLRACRDELSVSVCLVVDNHCKPTKCCDSGARGSQKHNCVAHLCHFLRSGYLTDVEPHALSFFTHSRVQTPSVSSRSRREMPRVLYEDDDIACIYKPAEWTCTTSTRKVKPTWGRLGEKDRSRQLQKLLQHRRAVPLAAWLFLHFGYHPGFEEHSFDLVQRLERFVSGPLLVGKTRKGYELAHKQVRERDGPKDYLCLVHGEMKDQVGECRKPILMTEATPRISYRGEPAITIFEALASYESTRTRERYTLLHVRVVTGRSSQIRVHMQNLGHSVVGEETFVTDRTLTRRDRKWCPRVFLHKCRSVFLNSSSELVVRSCPLRMSRDLWQVIEGLRRLRGVQSLRGCNAPGLTSKRTFRGSIS